jgi:hypothetical protein
MDLVMAVAKPLTKASDTFLRQYVVFAMKIESPEAQSQKFLVVLQSRMIIHKP